ncbi:MAG: siroheme synthase CysG [Pseudomonadota bacterium]
MAVRPVTGRTPQRAAPARLAPLATLPVFFGLSGKRVVLAGEGEAAAWKAEFLAAAGATVEVYAKDPSEALTDLMARGAAAGRFVHHARPWDGGCLKGATLAVCEAATEGEGQAFACAAKAAGVPANVIDKPAFCTFQFGSIVNRSPVVVGISTAGAAPILGQAIRRRVETLLPPSLAEWAALAQSIRPRVMATLAPGRPRRAFWERFADAAFLDKAPKVERWLSAGGAEPAAGKVTLVGAGPGDAGLLTISAVRALQACDVILFDDLVSDEVLELARREAKRIAVGKRGARASCRQEDICDLMLRLAKAGRSVVRLKSGDPSIFGRSGEEIAALEAAGIAVDVIPGVTSASAMAARLGVSLTHRDHAQALTVLTGHSRRGELPDNLDVGALVGEGRTAIVYMGVRTCRSWVDAALGAGCPADMPAVAVANVSRGDEARWAGPIAALPDAVRDLGAGPVLIGVGQTFGGAAAASAALEPVEEQKSAPLIRA